MTNTTFTRHQLKVINGSYHSEHTVTISDVKKVNDTIRVIENSRSKETPQVGDIVQFTNKHGEYYAKAHVERTGNELYICEQAYIPFVSIDGIDGNRVSTSTSGGAWSDIPSNINYVGTKKKLFKIWGHSGACANGALDFQAEVSVWEYTEGEHEFTTRTHDKFYVDISKSDKQEYKYKISGSYKTAFRTDEEYQAWLKTYHGVEKDGAWGNSKIVWTLKQESSCIPIEEYLQIENAIVDSELSNGIIQECKRIIEGTTITTVKPYQKNRIVLEGEKRYKNAYMK